MEQKYQVFISYPREDGDTLARSLKDRLTQRGYIVFYDHDNLGRGDFPEALYATIAQAIDVLALIPPSWVIKIENPEDWVRKELSSALKLEKNVIPVMADGFKWPKTLPDELASLPNKNGVKVDYDYYDAVIEKIISFMRSRPINGESSDKLLMDYARDGDAQAMNELGLRYEFGSETIAVDLRKALAYYEQAAEKEDPGGLYNLGDIYERCSLDLTLAHEYGVEVSNSDPEGARHEMHEKALSCYTRSAKTDFLPAVYRLGNLAEEDHQLETAIKLYREAADKGYPPAMNALGYYFLNGIAPKSEPGKAEELFRKAADKYAPAAYNYARILETRNSLEAINCYERIAYGKNGLPEAAYALGKLYKNMDDNTGAAKAFHQALYGGIQEAEEELKRCWTDR